MAPESKTSTPANAGVKKGLPAKSLKDAEDAAVKVWDVARKGTAVETAVAKALGLKAASGGTWARYIALLRGFGLVTVTNGEIGLSNTGLDIVQDADDSKRQSARRTALLKLRAYSELVADYDGTELPAVGSIASKLRFEYGKTEDFALQAAQAFIDSLRHAGLLDGNIVRKSPTLGPSVGTSIPQSTAPLVNGAEAPIAPTEENIGEADEEVEAALDAAWDEEEVEDEDGGGDWESAPTSAVSLSMTLDLSKYRYDEVIQILVSLGLARPT